jgi:hypothetical protein
VVGMLGHLVQTATLTEPWDGGAWVASAAPSYGALANDASRAGGRSSPIATGGGHCHCASATLVLAGRALYVPCMGSAEPVNDWQPRVTSGQQR